ncbi:hypothetical protein L6452_19609 [Arctium lappa]|uniref:Uncharacterized protein n=1 Tax=Arctium lappa TaxID=4217 RepID=A0ACB9B8J1_ARCLA|nr:hypothetical protein L6452_19609 [Arctium lappa]
MSKYIKFSVAQSRSQAAARRVAPTTTISLAVSLPETLATTSGSPTTEKHLPNGDLYIESFSGNVPHGSGKYLRFDGCMYEGDWKRGEASGKRKFSWRRVLLTKASLSRLGWRVRVRLPDPTTTLTVGHGRLTGNTITVRNVTVTAIITKVRGGGIYKMVKAVTFGRTVTSTSEIGETTLLTEEGS